MNFPHFITTKRTNQRDATGAIVLQGRQKIDWLGAIGSACRKVTQTCGEVKQVIEQRLDRVWDWICQQDRVLNSWIKEGLDQLADAKFQYEV